MVILRFVSWDSCQLPGCPIGFPGILGWELGFGCNMKSARGARLLDTLRFGDSQEKQNEADTIISCIPILIMKFCRFVFDVCQSCLELF